MKVYRRKYLKYAAAGIIVVGAASTGYYYYGSRIQPTPSLQTMTPTNTKTTYQRGFEDVAYITISVTEARQLVETNSKEEIVILDVRSIEEYHEVRIEGAIPIPLQNLQEKYTMLDKSKIVIVYSQTGIRSAKASQILIDKGFTKVYNMDGGITAWINEEFPIIEPNDCGC